ncbi:hypothetical protein K491DRAFT_718053 [Lophiostoma macrostomum CBS 122681]|uniref:Uncharacterized protein n=1 Tax=Lophiostoma macrostomum CBS 122681 TaxID=1314788 RepID=A0A6A6T3G5_9PLEO|nr:hypothetical protein K491DRAFT_718053 [Lophiostoma macrostomum CBS 122681]
MVGNEYADASLRADPEYLDAIAEEFLNRAFPNGLPTGSRQASSTSSTAPFIPLEKGFIPESFSRQVSLPTASERPRPAPGPSSYNSLIPDMDFQDTSSGVVPKPAHTVTNRRDRTVENQRRATKLETRLMAQTKALSISQIGGTVQEDVKMEEEGAGYHDQSTHGKPSSSQRRARRRNQSANVRDQHDKRGRKKAEK